MKYEKGRVGRLLKFKYSDVLLEAGPLPLRALFVRLHAAGGWSPQHLTRPSAALTPPPLLPPETPCDPCDPLGSPWTLKLQKNDLKN